MKLEDLVGEPAMLAPVVVTAESPTNGDVLRHFWYLQNAASRRQNGLYTLDQLFAEVARDLIDHYSSRSLTTIAHNSIVRYSWISDLYLAHPSGLPALINLIDLSLVLSLSEVAVIKSLLEN